MRKATISRLSLALALLATSAVGCQQTSYTTGTTQSPQPLGAVIDPHIHAMVTNAQASDFIIYQHEFIGSTVQLTSEGQNHLKQIARRLCETPFPVLIEPVTFRPFENHMYEEKEFTDMNRERRELLELDRARRETADADRRAEIDAARRQEVVLFLNSLVDPYAESSVLQTSQVQPDALSPITRTPRGARGTQVPMQSSLNLNDRVFVSPAYSPGISGVEGARAYDRTVNQGGNSGGGGRGGFGGSSGL